MSNRSEHIQFKIMPNGNIRAFLNNVKKTSVSEWQVVNPHNVCHTVITAHVPKMIEYGD